MLHENTTLGQLRAETMILPMGAAMTVPEQAAFLAFLIKALSAKRVIEVGTFTGYGALAMASALPDEGQLICLEISHEWQDIAEKYWAEAEQEHKIDLRIAPADESLAALSESEPASFDFIYIDADKANYDSYYEYAITLLRPGGMVALDNVLLNGRVDDQECQTKKVVLMRALNNKIACDDRVSSVSLTMHDGLTLALKN